VILSLANTVNLNVSIYGKIGQENTFQWENPSRKRKNCGSNEHMIDFLLGNKISGIRKKMAIRIAERWNSVSALCLEFDRERSSRSNNLTGYDFIYEQEIPNITSKAINSLCKRLGI